MVDTTRVYMKQMPVVVWRVLVARPDGLAFMFVTTRVRHGHLGCPCPCHHPGLCIVGLLAGNRSASVSVLLLTKI
jgi:hypothetical protein